MQHRRTAFVLTLLVVLAAFGGFTAMAGSAIQMLINGSFEEIVFTWDLKYGSGDAVKCAPKVPAGAFGDCAFKFKGSPDEVTKLSQKVDSIILMGANAALSGSAGNIHLNYFYYSTSDATKIDAKIVVVWTPDGGSVTKSKLVDSASGSTLSGVDYIWATEGPISTIIVDQGATISKVKVLLKNGSSGGKAYIDNITATMSGPSS